MFLGKHQNHRFYLLQTNTFCKAVMFIQMTAVHTQQAIYLCYGIALHYTSVEYYYYNNPTSCFVIEYQLIAPKPIIEYHFYTPHSLCQRANYSGASSACKLLWFPPMFLCLVLRDIYKGQSMALDCFWSEQKCVWP